MTGLIFFNQFFIDQGNGIHDMGSDTFKLLFTDVQPDRAVNTVVADLTEISAGGGYPSGGLVLPISSWTQTDGIALWTSASLSFIPVGDVGPFRYLAIYNSTASGGPLVGYYDRGSELILHSGGDPFVIVFSLNPVVLRESSTNVFIGMDIVTDHGDLTGLSDNDHPQYALVSGLAPVATSGDYADLTGTPPASALALLEEHIASSSAQLDFVSFLSSDYDEYEIHFINVLPATNGVDLYLRMSVDGGGSYDSAAHYGLSLLVFRAGGSGSLGSEGGAAQIPMIGQAAISNDASWGGVSGKITLFNPGSSAVYKNVQGMVFCKYSGDNFRLGQIIVGTYEIVTVVNALRFFMSSGNIANGTIRLYGIKH